MRVEEKTINEIPSMKISTPNGKNVWIKVSVPDARKELGNNISAQALRKGLIAGISKNGARRVLEEQAKIDKINVQIAEKRKNESPTKKFLRKYALPIVLSTAIAGFVFFGPNGILLAHPVEHHIPIDVKIYSIQDPTIIMEGMVGLAGQEQLTANSVVSKDRNVFEGTYYKAGTQADAETKAVSYIDIFQKWRTEIDNNMGVLANKNATQEEILNAVDRLLEIEKAINEVFRTNEPFVEEYKQKFAEASIAAKDKITEKEIQGTDLMLELFKTQIGLSSNNVSQLEMVKNIAEEAKEEGGHIEIYSVALDQDMNYYISGEIIETLMRRYPNLTPEDISASWKEFIRIIDTTKPLNTPQNETNNTQQKEQNKTDMYR